MININTEINPNPPAARTLLPDALAIIPNKPAPPKKAVTIPIIM